MDTAQLSQAVMAVLEEYAGLSDPADAIQPKTVFDLKHLRFQLVKHGWKEDTRYFYTVAFLDIKDGLIWVQEDNTEAGIANLLLEKGVPKQQIVLGFQPPEYRKYTDFNPSAA